MKKKLIWIGPALLLAAHSMAATVELVEVDATSINCSFSPTCSLQVSNVLSPITLPGTIGAGFLQSRFFLGETGSLGAGIYGYEYRLDLTGLIPTNTTPCFTNWVRCFTNRVAITNTIVTCRTNAIGVSNVVTCRTNVTPATNLVFCLTNLTSPTNIVRCFTNAGAITCFTNFFPGTNATFCLTNRLPAHTNIVCQTNRLTASNVVVCVTNRMPGFTNLVTCFSNSIPCPATTPCIDALRLHFGPIYSGLRIGTGTVAGAQAYVVTSGGLGTIEPVIAQQTGGEILFQFGQPVCPGESSVFFGVLSTNPPTDLRTALRLTSGSNVVATALGPVGRGTNVIHCDFAPLMMAVAGLSLRDIIAPNDNARRGRRGALLNMVAAASEAAEKGELGNVLEDLESIQKKSGGDRNAWLTDAAGRRLEPILNDLLNCLGQSSSDDENNGNHEDQGDDDDDDEQGDDGPRSHAPKNGGQAGPKHGHR